MLSIQKQLESVYLLNSVSFHHFAPLFFFLHLSCFLFSSLSSQTSLSLLMSISNVCLSSHVSHVYFSSHVYLFLWSSLSSQLSLSRSSLSLSFSLLSDSCLSSQSALRCLSLLSVSPFLNLFSMTMITHSVEECDVCKVCVCSDRVVCVVACCFV